eukprot:COSAG01_NODE_4268_length_5196_cov_4.984304_2_plen_330_part_00
MGPLRPRGPWALLAAAGTVAAAAGGRGVAVASAPPHVRWNFPTGDIVYSSPALGPDGTVYVGSYDRKLYAVTAEGQLKWSFPTGGHIYSSPALGPDGTVYVGLDDGKLYAVFCGFVPSEWVRPLRDYVSVPTDWRLACILASCGGVLSLLILIPHAKRTLQALRRIRLPPDDNHQGCGGLVLFAAGILDLGLSLNTSRRLLKCDGLEGHLFLFGCFALTMVTTWVATVYLTWHTLQRIKDSRVVGEQQQLLLPRPSADSAEVWRSTDLSLGASSATSQSSTTQLALHLRWRLSLVVLCSISRFQSLAILRLRLCGRTLLDYPMEVSQIG